MMFKGKENYPKDPGVYIMKDAKGHVLYVGKAKNLHARIKQYFMGSDERPSIPFLLKNIASIDTIVTLLEKEALLLENTLIKKHQPKYNILLKDDKSYVALKLTKHEWPMLQMVRYKGRPPKDGTYFGPYLHAKEARHLLDLIATTFPLRQCTDRELISRTRPCILYQMGRCIAPCTGLCTKEEYALFVKRAVEFLQGRNKELLKELYSEMEELSEKMEYEKAASLLMKIQQLEKALEDQSITSLQRIDLDAIGLYREADALVLSQLFFREGTLIHVETHHFQHSLQEDEELLASFLIQHYLQKEELPYAILLPLPLKETASIEEILSEGKRHKVQLHAPKRGEKRALLEMAAKNAHASFHKKKDKETILQKTLLDIQEKLHLTRFPERIECFDNSHLFGEDAVSAMVVFTHGEKTPSQYRKYKTKAADDYAAFYEVLTRRYKRAKEENCLPQLVLIDGGKGQLSIAKKVFTELNIIHVDLIAITKEEGGHGKGIAHERLFHPEFKDPLILNPHSPTLFLLQQIRDEAHRFVLTYHRSKRTKKMTQSQLQQLPGIGPIKTKRLLGHFGSLQQVLAASEEALKKVKGITNKDVQSLHPLR